VVAQIEQNYFNNQALNKKVKNSDLIFQNDSRFVEKTGYEISRGALFFRGCIKISHKNV
jgi:hypothetical protein